MAMVNETPRPLIDSCDCCSCCLARAREVAASAADVAADQEVSDAAAAAVGRCC